MKKGNPNPHNRTGKYDIAPSIRCAFMKAIDLIQADSGKTLPQLMQDCIEEHGLLAVLDRVSKFTVREAAVSGTIKHDHKIEVIQAEIERVVAELAAEPAAGGTEIAVQDGSLLPDKVRIQ